MMSILVDFRDLFESEQTLVIMPIARLFAESIVRAGPFVLYPPGEIDFAELRPVPNAIFNRASDESPVTVLDLREVCSDLTAFDLDVLSSSPVVAFRADIDWISFLKANHKDDVSLLQKLNQIAEAFLDIVRFDLCRFDLPDTLPGRVGSWTQSGPYLGALLYNAHDHESYLIAGPAAPTTAVIQGIGLDVGEQEFNPPQEDREVGKLARYALTLFRDVLESSSETQRFTRAMTLFEFLASPNSYSKMQEVKKEIAVHVASDARSYQEVLDRFRELTSFKDEDGTQRGLRTLLTHHGQYIEDILPSVSERRLLFRDLQGYASAVLRDMLDRTALSWDQFLDFRRLKRQSIGVSPEG